MTDHKDENTIIKQPFGSNDAANQLNKERSPPPQEISSGGFSGGFFCCVGGRGNGDQHPMKRNGDKPSIDNSPQIMSGDNPTSDALTTCKDDDTNVVPNDQVAHKNEQELNDVTNEPKPRPKRRNSADKEQIKLILYDQNSLPCAPVAVREHIGGNIPASIQSNEPSILTASSQVDTEMHDSKMLSESSENLHADLDVNTDELLSLVGNDGGQNDSAQEPVVVFGEKELSSEPNEQLKEKEPDSMDMMPSLVEHCVDSNAEESSPEIPDESNPGSVPHLNFSEGNIETMQANIVSVDTPVGTPKVPLRNVISTHSIENSRYSFGKPHRSDHPNDDTYFHHVGANFKVFAVFDGHDGSNASIFACKYMKDFFVTRFDQKIQNGVDVSKVLESFFEETERMFFESMREPLDRKISIALQLQGLTSYKAYMQYPDLVTELQELEPLISGGTTSVVVITVGDTVYVANTGDSRAVLVEQIQDDQNTLVGEQLSEDHTTDNDYELERLKELGLDTEELKKAGRLGSQENTRCIGDYLIKEGYTEMDTIKHALKPPGIATPTIKTIEKISPSTQYLLLMTDGVYKSIENMHENISTTDALQELCTRLKTAEQSCSSNLKEVSKCMLETLKDDHHGCYQKYAQVDVQSLLAVQCRKRDDMTLVTYRIGKST